jgi:hypothetical protein
VHFSPAVQRHSPAVGGGRERYSAPPAPAPQYGHSPQSTPLPPARYGQQHSAAAAQHSPQHSPYQVHASPPRHVDPAAYHEHQQRQHW